MISRILKAACVVGALLCTIVARVEAQSGYTTPSCDAAPAIRCFALLERRTDSGTTVYRASILALWRASPGDPSRDDPIDSLEAVRIMAASAMSDDSLRALGRSRIGHGSIYGHAYLAFSRRRGGREILATLPDSAFLADAAFRVPAEDSTLILLVDGLERSGYRPAVIGIVVPDGRVAGELQAWVATTLRDARIAAFLARTP